MPRSFNYLVLLILVFTDAKAKTIQVKGDDNKIAPKIDEAIKANAQALLNIFVWSFLKTT